MKILQPGICPVTGKQDMLVFSNNPLIAPVGAAHLAANLDFNNLEDGDMFCRTFNFPFNPEYWIQASQQHNPIEHYIKYFVSTHKENLFYTTTTADVWKEANKEWERSMTHRELLERIKPIKDEFIEIGKISWGVQFTFHELISLETMYNSTVSKFDIQNPMQLDAVRKVCITSIMIDKILTGSGDIKELKDLTNTHSQLMKMAKIDEMLETSDTEVIRTVADLAAYLESTGFMPEYYDGVDRDIVDKTIKDLKQHLITLVTDSTGLDATLELMQEKYLNQNQDKLTKEAVSAIDLETIMEEAKREEQDLIDNEFIDQEILEDEEYLDD